MTPTAIRAEGLSKRYGRPTDPPVLDGLDLEVGTGTVCALLGPNGAGKTTVVRILTTLLRSEGGRATVAGYDVVRQAQQVRRSIGLVGQNAAVDEILGARENLVMFGRLYHLPVAEARRRADALLEQFDIADTGDKAVTKFSGGMRRRLDLAASLIMTPPVLFLDEPTTGLDPQGRLDVWAAVRELVRGGTTVLLTTQYLEEADRLADQVCVLDGGRIAAQGTPDELKSAIGGDRIDVVVADPARLDDAVALVARATGVAPDQVRTDRSTRQVTAPVADRMAALTAVVRAMDDAGLAAEDVGLRRPTLDEAYLRLTGHTTDDDPPTTERSTTEVAA